MDREHRQLTHNLVDEIVRGAAASLGSQSACLLVLDPASGDLTCRYGTSCSSFLDGKNSTCSIPFRDLPAPLQDLLNGHQPTPSGFVSARDGCVFGPECQMPKPSSQLAVPLRREGGLSSGLLIFHSTHPDKFHESDLSVAQAFAGVCATVIRGSQRSSASSIMVSKLRLLSDASNVLLSEFEDRPLPDKFDFIVEKATTILDAELCSLWFPKDGKICLETSYSQQGKVLIKRRIAHPIKEGTKSGMTGYLAACKEVFNDFGESLLNHPARNADNPVDFLDSQQVYSELAFPLLDENEDLIGLLIAYNKLNEDGKPTLDSGFSKDLDEPLMKVLTTKLAISIKNARLLKKLRDYELIVESTPDPVVICSLDGRINYMNPGAVELFGDLRKCLVQNQYHAENGSTGLAIARDIKQQILNSKDKCLKNYDVKFITKTGQIIPISLSASIIYDDHGNEAGTVGIAKDLQRIEALLVTGQSMSKIHEVDAILQQIAQVCLRLPKSIRAYIKLYDKRTDSLLFGALSSRIPNEKIPLQSAPKFGGMTGYVFRTQRPHLSNDVMAEPEGRYCAIFTDVRSKIVVPITYVDKENGQVRKLGLISVDSDELHAFSNNDIYFLSTLANQAAVALENANLITSKNTIIRKLQAFDRIQQTATGKDLDVDHILESMLDAVVDLLGFKYATISAVDRATRVIHAIKVRNVSNEFLASDGHSLDSKDIQAWVVRHRQPVYLTGWDERLDKEIYKKFNHASLVRVIIPIIARGEVLGTLETGYDKARKSEIEQDEIETLKRTVSLAGMGIEQANLVNRLKQDLALRNELEVQLEALNQASIEILNATTENEAIAHIFESLESIGYSKGMLSLVNETTNCIEGRYAMGENWRAIVHRARCEFNGKNILAQALRTKNSILKKSCTKESICDGLTYGRAGIRSQYVIPLIAKEKAIGTLQIDLSDWQELVKGEEQELKKRMKVVESFARQVAIAIRNIRDVVTIDRLESNIAEAAHEFRSPLHNIMTQVGGLKSILEHGQPGTEIGQFVGVIEEEILRAKRQMDNTLLLSDHSRLNLEYDFKPGFLQDVVAGCEGAYRLRALERGLRIIIKDSVRHLPRLHFDRDRMEQAITNLIDNAVKYSHFNQYITITGFDDGTRINLEIADRGLGIPEREYDRIFLGFARSEARDKTRYIPGTGLGLKICREIIRRHGGEIKVRSVAISKNPQKIKEFQDYATSFTLTLPKQRLEN